MDHSHSTIFVGLAVIAAIASLANSVRPLSLDEAAVCQAVYELKTEAGLQVFPRSRIYDRFIKLVDRQIDLNARFAAALESLARLRVVAVETARDDVTLLALVVFKKRPDSKQARSTAA